MKKLLKILKLSLILIILFSIFTISCSIVKDDTGGSYIRLNPIIHKQVGDAAQATTDILGLLSMFIPVLAPIAAAGATGTYIYRIMGREVTKYKTPLTHTINVLEVLKQDKKLWEQVKPYLKGTAEVVDWNKPSAATEATIREVIDYNNGAI